MRKIPVNYLLEYARAQLGNPYWYGTYGQILNSAIWRDNAKRYPRYYTDKRKETARARGDYGKKGHDCSGLIKGALWTYPQKPNMPAKYTASEDMDANTMMKQCTESGSIATIPEIAGLAVWKNNHIGIYIGGGKVIEAKGFDFGVIESKLTDTKWTKWGKLAFVEYAETEQAKPEPKPAEKPTGSSETEYIVKKGDTLTKIAKMWNTTVKAVADYNGIKNANLIQVGQIIKKPMASAKPEPAPVNAVWAGIVTTNNLPLNIRSGAGKNYPVVGQIAKGSKIMISGASINGWYKLADGRGYVSSSYVKKA